MSTGGFHQPDVSPWSLIPFRSSASGNGRGRSRESSINVWWWWPWFPDGDSRIFRSYVCGPSGFWTMAPIRCAAKFVIWQPWWWRETNSKESNASVPHASSERESARTSSMPCYINISLPQVLLRTKPNPKRKPKIHHNVRTTVFHHNDSISPKRLSTLSIKRAMKGILLFRNPEKPMERRESVILPIMSRIQFIVVVVIIACERFCWK